MTAPKRQNVFAGGAGARYLFMGAALFLTAFGAVMIYSASSVNAAVREGSSWHFFLRQLLFIGVGLFAAVIIERQDYRVLSRYARAVWYGSNASLVFVLALGIVRGGARRWLPLGLFNVQPSEFAKIACVLAVAALAVEWRRGRLSGGEFAKWTLWLTAVPAFLIYLQPDVGTMMTLVIAVAFVLVLGGVNLWMMGGAGAAAAAVGALAVFTAEYRMARVLGFMDPFADPLGKGYQIIQALYAFGSGGIGGVGLGLSRQKYFYLPEAHTDFILAIIGEETGLIGTLAVLGGFIVLVWAGFKIAAGARDEYGRLVAGGLVGMIAFQAVLNMAAVTGLLPITGKPLPFLSHGGSSILVTMVCVGLVLSVSRHGAHAPRAVRSRAPQEEKKRESATQRRRNSGARVPSAERRRNTRRRA